MPAPVLIVVFDALRPEFVTPDLMPNLCAFAARGVRFAAARSSFPTETRVNQSALTTGCYPRRHGVVANRFVLDGRLLDTGKEPQMAALAPGSLIGVPTMGEILSGAGRSLATISAGTGGGGRLINIAAEATGAPRFALRAPEASQPTGAWAEAEAACGPLPPLTVPGIEWNRHAVRLCRDHVIPRYRPDVMLLWLSEPDESFHWTGIGSPQSLDAIRAMDAGFGSLCESLPGHTIIALSDHGQISLAGGKIDIAERLRDAGFSADTASGQDPDTLVVVHSAGGLWCRDPARVPDLVACLRAAPWCGPLFTRGGLPGTLPLSAVMADHPRAPDVALVLAADDTPNRWNRAGQSADDSPYPQDGGCHGGLSRHELETVMILGGPETRRNAVVDVPSGIVDILPTVLALLGVDAPEMDGRVLSEAFSAEKTPVATHRTVVSDGGGPHTRLSVSEVAGTPYLNAAWRA